MDKEQLEKEYNFKGVLNAEEKAELRAQMRTDTEKKWKKAYITEKIEKCERLRDSAISEKQAATYEKYRQEWIGRLSKTAQKELVKTAAKQLEQSRLEAEAFEKKKAEIAEQAAKQFRASAEREAKETAEREEALKKLEIQKQIEALKALLPEEKKEVEVIEDLIEDLEEETEDEPSDSESEDTIND